MRCVALSLIYSTLGFHAVMVGLYTVTAHTAGLICMYKYNIQGKLGYEQIVHTDTCILYILVLQP